MTDMSELVRRKKPLNLAIVHVDPDAFLQNHLSWLEITAFIKAQRLGEAATPADGLTPTLSDAQLRTGGVHDVGNDAMFAFCMTAALKGDKAAVDKVDTALIERMGKEYPGFHGLSYFRMNNEAPITLEDFVGQLGKKMLEGYLPPPPMRAKENWMAGLRFFEKARNSNFKQEIMYPLARWTREKWEETADKGVAFLAHIEDNLPILRETLEDPRNDEAFIANLLLKMAPGVDTELTEDYQGMLRSLARREG